VVLSSDVTVPDDVEETYVSRYGPAHKESIAEARSAIGKPIASLFDLSRSDRARTEILFLERCIDLLRPGGRMGIVLPDGVFNNPSLAYVREHVLGRARLEAIVSLPQDTFRSAGASVKASLLFLRKYDAEEQRAYDELTARSREEVTRTIVDRQGTTSSRVRATNEKEIADAVRRRVNDAWDYAIFFYQAEHVGITATGEPDLNELYANESVPPGVSRTALELYREFKADPKTLPVLGEPPT
jgi:Type I restriction-modification system methyltransferase subunit